MGATTGELHGLDAESYREAESAVLAAVGQNRFAELLEAGRSEQNPSSPRT